MKTKITDIDIDWVEIKNKCRATMGKEPTSNYPSEKFKQDVVIAEHSPIRLGTIGWRWETIKSWIATHFARHWLGWDKFISTQRDDRIGGNRDEAPQGTLVTYDGNANIQALINVARFRLCYQASPETRQYMEDLKYTILHECEEPAISNAMIPNCIYRCGCPEFTSCGYWEAFKKQHPDIDMTNIRERYASYNSDFEERMKNG